MAEGRSIGTVFVELDLDPSRYTRAQQRLYKDATTTSLSIEDNFKKLGIKSSAEMDLMRAKIVNSFEGIKNHHQATANDIMRAEAEKNRQLAALDEQQYGRQVGMIEKLRANWVGALASITAAYFAAQQAWSLAGEAADYQERLGVLDALGAKAKMTGQEVVDAMQAASRGLLSMKDAADMSASALNLALSAEQMIEFTRVAEALTDVIGGSIKEAFDRMTVAAASGRTQTLAQMGILVDLDAAYRRYAESLGRSKDSLSEVEQQQVRLNAILDAAKAKVAALGPATDSARDPMDRFTAQLKDLQLNIGTGLLIGTQKLLGGFQALASGAITAAEGVWRFAEAYAQLDAWVSQKLGFTERAAEYTARALEMRAQADVLRLSAEDLAQKALDNIVGTAEAARNANSLQQHQALGEARIGIEQRVATETSKIHAKVVDDDIKSWVAYAEEQIALNDLEARYKLELIGKEVKAREAAEASAQAAIDATIRKEEELARKMRDDLSASATHSARVIATTMTDAFTEAARAASALAASLSVASGGGAGSVLGALQKGGSGLSTWWEGTERDMALSRLARLSETWGGMPIPSDIANEYVRLQIQGGVGQTALERAINNMGREFLDRQAQAAASASRVADHTAWVNSGVMPDTYGWSGFAEGGIVPGPVGVAQPAVVHGGEMVLTETDQRALLAMLRKPAASTGGPITVQVVVDGRVLGSAVAPSLEALARTGQFRVVAQ